MLSWDIFDIAFAIFVLLIGEKSEVEILIQRAFLIIVITLISVTSFNFLIPLDNSIKGSLIDAMQYCSCRCCAVAAQGQWRR